MYRGRALPDDAGQAEVTTPEDVRDLVRALADPNADDAYVTHLGRPTVVLPLTGDEPVPDHVVHLAVRDGWGYFVYAGVADGYPDGFTGHPKGDPRSPGTHGSHDEYPPASGLPLPLFTEVLIRFLESAELPDAVEWVELRPVTPM
ncbi:Imm1 family immunity protein [Saccharothrix coeruleofusca]|uniref:Immunity protein Imm1 n=1 Tax=Saccharothrix coeruleofusca TaxID=33919 RepID=A0A918ANA1_9PSEU|nr:Imm1 family immunity protein [Saccharothrix coeruleofusca]GGP59547.1 hypothetical protein GCM10010185_34850 [Saccharothrix coeruleofusca]